LSRFIPHIAVLSVLLLLLQGSAKASIEVDEEEIIFRISAPGAGKVFLTGDFNNWNHTMDSMVRRGAFWEIRLFLVPGRYRYMFVVDGENRSDPDNPHRDEEGMSFFIFRERDGEYEIIYQAEESRAEEKEVYVAGGDLTGTGRSDYSLFTASLGLGAETGDGISAGILLGIDYENATEAEGRACLLRAHGRYTSEKFALGAFHREGPIDTGDPLMLYGKVGPFDYPLDLFCRGAVFEGTGPVGTGVRALYANRIEGYLSGLESAYPAGCASLPHLRWNPEDTDILGLNVWGGSDKFRIEYLHRSDKGPGDLFWCRNGRREEGIFRGFRKKNVNGALLRAGVFGSSVVTAEYLWGKTDLSATGELQPGDTAFFESDELREWEDGYRAYVGIDHEAGRLRSGLSYDFTSISSDPDLGEGREDGARHLVEGNAKYRFGRFDITVEGSYEWFEGDGYSGRVFWLQRRNFWLDGDRLGVETIPFLDSQALWRAGLGIEEASGDSMPAPYRCAGYLEATATGDRDSGGVTILEVTGGKGIVVHELLSVHVDLRFVSYGGDRWKGDSDFLDTWIGLRSPVSDHGWIAFGVGVAPHRFDRWYYDFTMHGRESYILDRDLFSLVDLPYEDILLEELGEAEKEMAGDWRIQFESGFSF
jgi:hypothetical protein